MNQSGHHGAHQLACSGAHHPGVSQLDHSGSEHPGVSHVHRNGQSVSVLLRSSQTSWDPRTHQSGRLGSDHHDRSGLSEVCQSGHPQSHNPGVNCCGVPGADHPEVSSAYSPEVSQSGYSEPDCPEATTEVVTSHSPGNEALSNIVAGMLVCNACNSVLCSLIQSSLG